MSQELIFPSLQVSELRISCHTARMGLEPCLGAGPLTPDLVLFLPHAWDAWGFTFIGQRMNGFEVSKDSFQSSILEVLACFFSSSI